MRPRRLLVSSLALVAGLAVGAAACDTDDGRELRPPTSEQVNDLLATSPSTTSTTTLVPPESASPTLALPITPTAPTAGPGPTLLATGTTAAVGAPSAAATAATAPATAVASAAGVQVTTTGPTTSGAGDAQVPRLPGRDDANGNQATTTLAPGVTVGPPAARLVAPWSNGGAISAAFTCDGGGAAPVFSWSATPGITELALTIVDDQGAVGLAVTGLTPDTTRLDLAQLPAGAVLRPNSWGRPAYEPLCPAAGASRTYTATLYLLARPVAVAETASVVELFADLGVASLSTAAVTGTYTRPAA